MKEPLLTVCDLEINFHQGQRTTEAVKRISFDLYEGETLGLVGESGSGKSISALSILKLLPDNASHQGYITFNDQNLLSFTEDDIRKVRGHQIGMIFQEPMTALNPLHTIEKQICEVLSLHLGMRPNQAKSPSIRVIASGRYTGT